MGTSKQNVGPCTCSSLQIVVIARRRRTALDCIRPASVQCSASKLKLSLQLNTTNDKKPTRQQRLRRPRCLYSRTSYADSPTCMMWNDEDNNPYGTNFEPEHTDDGNESADSPISCKCANIPNAHILNTTEQHGRLYGGYSVGLKPRHRRQC